MDRACRWTSKFYLVPLFSLWTVQLSRTLHNCYQLSLCWTPKKNMEFPILKACSRIADDEEELAKYPLTTESTMKMTGILEEVAVTKKPAAAKQAVKDSSSSEDEDDSEDESEDDKPVAKKEAPVAAKVASCLDSDEESEDENPAPKAKEDTKSAKKDSSRDESRSGESENEDEDETPNKKSSDVEMVDAEMKQVGHNSMVYLLQHTSIFLQFLGKQHQQVWTSQMM
ncbi:Uncharacterized protein Rs2_04946 [Raphanus sativus]|nr:Uncharacterized protein Rs2_04946 [Raphanus sativus]